MKLAESSSIFSAPLLKVGDVARLLAVQTRTVYRLKDEGKLPQPIKIGHSTRWRQGDIDAWIANGCRAVR